MKRTRVRDISVGKREVDSEAEINLTASKYVFEERVLPFNLEIGKFELTLATVKIVILRAFSELGK